MRIMTSGAVGGSKRLIVMRLLQRCIFNIVTIDAQRRGALG